MDETLELSTEDREAGLAAFEAEQQQQVQQAQQRQQQQVQQQVQQEAAAAALPDNGALAAAGWTVYADPTTGLPFYHHTKTGASSWVSPL